MKNKKMAVAGISLLGSIGVISTGFAGWIITAPAQIGSGTGSITADGDVQTKGSVTIGTVSYGADIENADICFAANNSSAGNGWLKSDQSKKADLNATVNIPLTISTDVTKINFTKVKLEATGDNAKNYASLAPKIVGSLPTLQGSAPAGNFSTGYILVGSDSTEIKFGEVTGHATNGMNVSTQTFIGNKTSLNFKFEVRFAWGTDFGGNNPLDYYNGQPWDKTIEATAKEKIAKLADLNNLGFKLSFTVSAE